MKVFLASVIMVLLSVGVSGQNSLEKSSEYACDFSRYKPLVVSHILLNSVVKKVEPEYPPAAKAVNAQGEIKVLILVDRNGNVINACAVEGHPLLRPAARNAALQWKFKKNFGFKKKPKKKYIQETLSFNFRLDQNAK